jgi:tRNA(Ile)-lysidine synthase TilS/MesJ
MARTGAGNSTGGILTVFCYHALSFVDIHPHILTLDWSSPSLTLTNGNNKPDKTHLETLARLERYKAIAQQCHHLDIRQLFVGHHSGDQVETVLFRFARASGLDGLAGIQPDAPFGVVNVQEALDLRVVRPLLSVSKVCKFLNEPHAM